MNLPPLDCHAHISTSVTDQQLAALGPAIVMAMTRSVDEAFEASQRLDPNIIWGCGAHPAHIAETGSIDPERFARRARDFALIGEVGLDRRSGNLDAQRTAFSQILEVAESEPVLVSIHSAGCSRDVLDLLSGCRSSGLIMHWFSGQAELLPDLLDIGCYFSVNTAMRSAVIEALPIDRILPETDFPVARRRTGRRPGDTATLESLLADIFGTEPAAMRRQFYRNLRRISMQSGAIDRMPPSLVELLLTS